MPNELVHAVVLGGVVIVLPLVFGGWRRWALAGAAVAGSFMVPVGAASAAVASIWFAVAAWTATVELRRPDTPLVSVVRIAGGFGVVAASAFVMSRGGVSLFGIGEPIVELTAVHFTYAGVGAVTLAGAVATGRVGRLALLATAAAPPIVALGFVVAHPVAQVGGAVLMSAGVLATATLQLHDAANRTGGQRLLLTVSGLAPWAPMVLAVAWASSLYWNVPALSVPDMARTHGVMNVVFVVAGLLARRQVADHPGRRPAGAPHVMGAVA
ncbi:MAG: YndJ family protein [Actinomycetota bacterium]|nr:YndJ family protein [Actinomycetota bacterium]